MSEEKDIGRELIVERNTQLLQEVRDYLLKIKELREEVGRLESKNIGLIADSHKLRDGVIRGAGMAGLLSEILGKGVLSHYGDEELIDRVKLAVSDHEQALKESGQ